MNYEEKKLNNNTSTNNVPVRQRLLQALRFSSHRQEATMHSERMMMMMMVMMTTRKEDEYKSVCVFWKVLRTFRQQNEGQMEPTSMQSHKG